MLCFSVSIYLVRISLENTLCFVYTCVGLRYFMNPYTGLSVWCFQQNTAQQQQVQMLQNEMDKLRSDNVKLYEKIKFLQSYPTKVN